ncbi:MAG TPA: glycosyltransferase family 4 protein [Thermoguttaceae bacterium]|nr:glycosyltransferase family 4 protein [Thermoguttaceae bacterium]
MIRRRITLWHVGGEDVHLRIPLLLKLRERGFHVGAVGSRDGRPFAEHDIPYYHYPLQRFVTPLADLRARKRLFELFKRHQPDIVHGFNSKPAIFAMFAARQAKIPGRVRTITGMGYVFSSSSPLALGLRPVIRHLQRKASEAASMTIFQNSDDRDYFCRHRLVLPGRHALVLGSGVDIEEFSRGCPDAGKLMQLREQLGASGRPVVTMISRLVRTKGVLEYLRAAHTVHRRFRNACFLLVGPLASEGRQGVSQSEIERYRDDVQYLGRRDDVAALLAVSDLFVLPSYYREGIPRVLLEAGAMGLPLITTGMPGCKEVVRHGLNGLVVPPRKVNPLADAISKMLDSPIDRDDMGRVSRRHVLEHFDLEIVANAYEKIYRRSLDQSNT